MRYACLFLLASMCPCAQAFGQARTEAKITARPDLTLPNYRVTRTSGKTFLIVSYTKSGQWYTFLDIHEKKTNNLASLIEKIEPLPEGEAIALIDKADSAGEDSRTSSSRGPRVQARTEARTSPPRGKSQNRQTTSEAGGTDDSPSPASFSSGGYSSGTTATGLSLHTGPRGGVYHYSANGNKVYQRKK